MPLKVLIVDDTTLVCQAMEAILDDVGYRTRSVTSGSQALVIFEEWKPDAVLCDILMPDQDGVETIARMRELSVGTPLVAMSGGGRTGKAQYLDHARELGADATIEKPVKRAELLGILDRLLNPQT